MEEETYAQKLFPDKMFEPKLIRWVKKIKIGILEELKEKILSKSV